jgi:hypothetical protein
LISGDKVSRIVFLVITKLSGLPQATEELRIAGLRAQPSQLAPTMGEAFYFSSNQIVNCLVI